MKKIFIITGIIALLISSCYREREIFPRADFSVNYSTVQPNELIVFNNSSIDGSRFFWDFGDGHTSDLRNPTHYYDREGTYNVMLTVTSIDGNVDHAYLTIYVIYTELDITVIEWNPNETIQFIVDYAQVWVYDNLNDWLYDEDGDRAVVYGTTDKYGEITFLGLEERSYYIYVQKVVNNVVIYDNYGFYLDGWDNYFITPVLYPNSINTWIAWVDYLGDYKKAANGRKSSEARPIRQARKFNPDNQIIKRGENTFIKVDVSD